MKYVIGIIVSAAALGVAAWAVPGIVVAGALAAVAVLTALPASLGARRPAAPILQAGAA